LIKEDRTIVRLQRKNDSLRAKSLQRDEPRLRKQLADTREQYEALCLNIGNELPRQPRSGPPRLWFNVSQLNSPRLPTIRIKCLPSKSRKSPSTFPNSCSTGRCTHPPLTDAQKQHYKHKLRKLFDGLTELPSGGFFSLKASEILT
jgi:hypothetical protein